MSLCLYMFVCLYIRAICFLRLYYVGYDTIRYMTGATNFMWLYQKNVRSPMAISPPHHSINTPLSPWRRDGLEARKVCRCRQLEQLKIPKNHDTIQNVS